MRPLLCILTFIALNQLAAAETTAVSDKLAPSAQAMASGVLAPPAEMPAASHTLGASAEDDELVAYLMREEGKVAPPSPAQAQPKKQADVPPKNPLLGKQFLHSLEVLEKENDALPDLSDLTVAELEAELPHTPFIMMPGTDPKGRPFSLNEALVYALENQISLEISQLSINVQAGVLRSAASPFDYNVVGTNTYLFQDDLQRASVPIKTKLNGNETLATLSATTLTRPGTAFAVSAQVDRLHNPLNSPATVNNNVGSVSFLVQQPLLRGFLNGVNWMQEKAARMELYARYYDDFHAVSQNIFSTTTAYWEAVAAQKAVGIQEEGLRRLRELTENIKQLIKNSLLARTDIHQPQQKIVKQQISLLEAQQFLFSTIQQLEFVMGDVSVTDFKDEVLYLTDDFPLPPLDVEWFQTQFPYLLEYSIRHRYDIQASTLRQKQIYFLLKGANNDRLPTLNVTGQVTMPNFETGEAGKPLLSPLEMHQRQTNWSLGINIAMPLYNDGAMGVLQQRKAQYAQAILSTQLLMQQALTILPAALSSQIVLSAQLKEAEQNVRLNRLLFAEGVVKLQAGFISLFDLLSFEENLTTSLLQRNDFRKKYMQNIGQIRFLTATLFWQGENSDCIEVMDITSLPEIGSGRPENVAESCD